MLSFWLNTVGRQNGFWSSGTAYFRVWPAPYGSLVVKRDNAPVICIPGSPGAGDSGDIAGLKCLALTSDVSRQCRGFAGVMISRQ